MQRLQHWGVKFQALQNELWYFITSAFKCFLKVFLIRHLEVLVDGSEMFLFYIFLF